MTSPPLSAVLDVGTNNIQTLIASKNDGQITVFKRFFDTAALGRNMKSSHITRAGFNRAKSILRERIPFAGLFTSRIAVIGTSCSREAANINVLSDWLSRRFQLAYHIISGETEALWNALANLTEFPELQQMLLFDIGGGSTEFSLLQQGRIAGSLSLPLGIRRLQNSHPGSILNKRNEVRKMLHSLTGKFPGRPSLIGIGGTVTSLSALQYGISDFLSDEVHKTRISLRELDLLYRKISRLNRRQLAALLPVDPARSDIVLTGTMIVQEIMDYFKADSFLVSNRGLQFGFLHLPVEQQNRYFSSRGEDYES
ncbi:MAG: hypothetical protein JW784_06270 [Candidatus Cloacimonetes bacterium]|nr:hypothetical protein [Candidatus Cloacimonadota bacterium]